uniref:Type I restriction enzyme n=1 Tax=Podoviridae sp. ctIi96 TaxID=2826550 RepID=A0A8S5M1U0_9CAUD|nr:MAG TPA: Type I restriction enzyme [Podoviridae sp. ctIi96]
MDSNIKHLYDTMISRGYTGLGDFSNFEGKMKDSGKRKLVYDHLMQDDYFSEIGDFSKFESALGYSPVERKDYVSQSRANPAPIALRQEADVPMKDQSEYVNPWTNSPDYNFESLRKKGKIETATPPPPTEYEKDSSFMNTWVGDAIQKLNAGGADLGAGIFGVLDKESKGLESSTGGLISRGGAFKDISDRFKADAEFSRARSNRYNGKDFIDLWKEGNYMGAIGDIALQGIESLPMSIGAMAATMAGAPAAGLAGIGSIVASQKYDDLDQNNPNMGEFAKVSNAIITGTAESLSEMLGAGVSKAWMSTLFKTLGKEKAQEAIKRGIMGKMQELYKKFGMFFEPVNEGVEEVSSTLAENITDKITGADPERDLTDGVLQSFVYGMGGGAYFTGTGALAKGAQYVADKIGGKQAQQPITDSNVTDQGVNTPPQSTKSIIDDAFEQGRNMSDKGDLRDLSLQMEASRTALTEKNPNLAIRMEQYIDNGASENQINEMLKGVDNETRELAYDFYINTQKIKGVEDKSIENINNEVDSYMSDNIIPYVSISPNGRQVISTATFKEGLENKKVYIRSINGDNVIISDNGNNRMVPMSSLSDIEENDVEQIRNSYRQQLLVTRQSELDMAMNHNPKTQLPKPGLVIWNGDNAFILQGQDENGDWIAQPAALDKETGQVAPKAGSAPAMPITENEILDLQDAIYDAQQVNVVSPEDDNVESADAEITSAPPMEDAINQPTSEIETEGAIDQIAQPSNVENPSMVMREDGTPDFVSSGTDMTLDFLHDKYGDKMPRKIEVTRKSFDESLKKASDALEKAQEAYDDAPIGKEDKAEAALIKARQEYEAIKVEADFWANLDDDIKEASKKPGDVIAKEISVIGDPMSGEELAAMMLANGAIKLTRDSYKKETGAGNNETARMFGLFASPEKGGVNIERAGEILELADRENGTNFFDENDTNAGRDAIIEVLSSARTRGDLIDYVKRNREAIAERERQAEYNAYAEWCEENYHMSPEEYEAYEDDLRKQAEIVTEETIEYVNGEIADEIQAIINEQNEIDAILAQNNESNEEIERNDEGGTGGLLEGGDQLLQGEQPIQAGRVGEIKQGHTGVDGRVDRTDGAAQEGASIIDKIRYSSPVEITGNEISPSEDLREYKKNALEYGKSLRGEYINKDSGKTIFLGKNAIKEVLHHDYKNVEQLQSIAAIPKIIENAIFVTSQENTDSKVNAESFDYYVCGLRIGDVDYTVRAVFVKPKDGDRYYDHKLTRIEKGKLIDSLFGTTPGFNQTTSLVSGSEDKKLISILQDKVFEKDAKEAKSFVAPSPKENENPLDYAERIVEAKRLHDEELKVDTNPSEAQKEAGNYKKGHVKINGFDVSIEQPAGSVRSGKDASGKEWSQVMNNTYGYIRGTKGVDGDHIDVFLGPDMNSDMVYVVDQVNTDGSFDEHKVMMGFSSLEDARSAYLSNYEEGWQGLGNITGVALDEFKKWIDSSIRKTKPFSEYKSVVPVSPLTVSRSDKSNEYPLLDIAVDPIVWMKNNPGKTPTSKDLFPAGKADEYLGTIIDEQVVTTDKGITLKYTKYNNGYSITAEKEGGYIKQSYYNNGLPMTSPKFNIGVNDSSFKQYIKKSKDGTLYIDNKDIIPLFVEDVSRKVKKLSLVDKDDYITSAERKHIKAFLESGLKEARVNNSIYEISNIGDDGVYEIVRRFNYTDPLTLVKDENGKLVNKRGEGEHVIRVKPTFEETRPDSGIRFRETRIIPEEENIIKKAKSDGSYMKAPNGNPTNLNEKQWVQVRTKAFKEWFGDWENNPEDASKVIDENGEPRVVYHGTYSDFNAFDESHLGDVTDLNATNEDWAKTSHIGFWFNDNKIGFYTKYKPVYLNVRNPLEFASMESLVDEMSYYDSGEDFKRSNSDGYDSVIVLEDEEMGGRSYVVFNDNQIKSATENNEDFSFHNDETSKNEAVKQASEIDGAHFRSIGDKDTDNLNNAETIESSINDWSSKFNTPVRVIHDVDDINDTDENMLARKRDSKGWYDTSTGEIVIVSPNSTSVGDAQRTFLHEAVGHHGLRELFGDDFDTFLDNVYRNANEDIRKNIIDRTKGNPLNLREATEEYIAELAERGFDNKTERSLWEKIKDAFLDMLRKAGISLDFKLSDNDLRYILWRSYKNLEQGNLMDVAEDTVMRNDLGIGDFSVRFREAKTEVENEEPLNKEMVDAWDKVASSDSFKFKEAMVDSLTAIDEFLKLLAKKTKSKILDYENPYYALIALSSKNKADMDSFDSKFLNPLNEAIRALIGDVSEVSKKGLRRTWDWSKGPLRDLVKYVQSKHGIERNRDMSVRDGIETLKAFDVDALSKMGVISDSDLKNAKKTAEKVAEEKGSEAYKKTYDKVLGKELKKGVDKGKAERSAEIAADYRKSFVKSEIYNKEMDKYKEKVTGALIDRWEDSKKDVLNKDLAWDEEQKELDREALSFQWKLGDNSYGVILGKDYSGLSSVFKSSEDGANKDKWLSDAYDFVRDYESTHNMVLVDNLWDKVHNVSEYTLRRQYESGLISKSYMDKNLSRFKYFIPLRGFSDNIASDVYDYIDATEIKMGNPVKTAKGRISEADNPFAGLIHVGYGSITAGNRNLAKQRFLNLASNHDTGGLITIDNIWVRNVGTEENPEWVESIPQIPDNASGEEVAKAVKDHEEMMRELREEGKAELIKGGRSDIPYKTLYDQRSQHQVQVFVGGNRYVMTVNGNPRLAQAVNGLTNPDVKDDLAYVVARNLKTFMAGAFTSKNVAFSFANLIRDTPYANNSVFVTENFRYFKDFSGNQRRALFGLRSLGRNLYKYRRGEIDISDKEQAIFKEFMDNGGATGYTFVETQKEYAKDLANKLEKLSDGNIGKLSPKELVSTVFECFEFMGNVAELVNRYAAYKTSREHGRSIDRSINDAKEVSVNFNKKGAGKKTKSDKWYINTAAWISEYGRDWVLFFNAAVQSMYKEYSMLRNHPIKGIGSRIAPLIFMGSSVSLLNNLFMPMLFAYLGWDSDDDDRDYFDSLSDHERQNNICIRLTHGRWLKIPLSPELANYFKIGDIIAGQLSGKREVEAMDVVKTGIDMVSPLNINWEYDSWKFALNLLPTVVQPIAQNASNVNFMGNPIYKTSMNKANDYDPEYTKVYRSTSTTMVELSRALNSLTGGDDVKRGLSFNPATWQNIFSGYTGGFGTVALGVSDLVLDILSGEDGDMPVSRYPLLSRFLTGGDKDLKLSRMNSIYNKKVVDFVSEMDHDYKGYLEKSMDPSINILDRAEYIVKLEKFMKSDDFKKSQELSQYVRAISDMERFLREVGSDNDSLENQVYELKLRALEIFEDSDE